MLTSSGVPYLMVILNAAGVKRQHPAPTAAKARSIWNVCESASDPQLPKDLLPRQAQHRTDPLRRRATRGGKPDRYPANRNTT